jgi:hypothetical protein
MTHIKQIGGGNFGSTSNGTYRDRLPGQVVQSRDFFAGKDVDLHREQLGDVLDRAI